MLKSPTNSPLPRESHAMVYDAARAEVVMFGGSAPLGPDDAVWTWDGTNWTPKIPANRPLQRIRHAMIYDAARREVVMFGGDTISDGTTVGELTNETWTWDGTNWTQRTPANGPPRRRFPALAYDEARGQVVLFGGAVDRGIPGSLSISNDTWVWDGTNWTQKNPINSPPARVSHAMAYDAANGQVVLFSGFGQGTADTWVWDGINWTQKNPTHSPPARAAHSMTYDAANREVVMFGGTYALNDTWTWDGTDWTQKDPADSPSRRTGQAMAYDARSEEIVLFGGASTAETLRDTWVWKGSSPSTGSISVTTNASGATFTIGGPTTYTGSGTSFSVAAAPAGTYTITYAAVAGYSTPPTDARTLTTGGSISFSGVFLAIDSDGDGAPDFSDSCPGTSLGVAVRTNGCPYVEGRVGIWDGTTLWPLDGPRANLAYVRATLPDGTFQEEAQVLSGGRFRFQNLEAGSYAIEVALDYQEPINTNVQNCGTNLTGVDGQDLPKRVQASLSVNGTGWDFVEVRLPPPVVLVHGIYSSYKKWFSFLSISGANTWDDALRRRGYISLTPNYRFLIRDDDWSNAVTEVSLSTRAEFIGLSSLASTTQFPPWIYVGHSQGGLVGRAIINDAESAPLVQSLRSMFMLGTPNDGALVEALNGLVCVGYLAPNEIQRVFNLRFPSFSNKSVWAFAGNGSGAARAWDGVVSVGSVHTVTCKTCTPKKTSFTISGNDYPYKHDELGSAESIRILNHEILPRMSEPSVAVRKR